MFDEKCALSTRIYLLLKFIGMDQSTLGFFYTKEILKVILEESEREPENLNILYQDIYLKYNERKTTSIERVIRHAKECCLKELDNNLKTVIFGNSKKMTNSNFIHALANFISYM